MTLHHSDRYRRTTSETDRFSVQTTFSQFVSALHQLQTTDNSSFFSQVLASQTHGSTTSTGNGFNLFGLLGASTSAGSTSSSSTSSARGFSTQATSDQFVSIAQQAPSTPTCSGRSR